MITPTVVNRTYSLGVFKDFSSIPRVSDKLSHLCFASYRQNVAIDKYFYPSHGFWSLNECFWEFFFACECPLKWWYMMELNLHLLRYFLKFLKHFHLYFIVLRRKRTHKWINKRLHFASYHVNLTFFLLTQWFPNSLSSLK